MAGKVIKRELPKKHGFAVPVNLPSSYEEAEAICGHKLDRRKNYAIIDEEVCELCEWTQPCSGCSCDGDYPCSCCNERGAGCEECGYTGKRKMRVWKEIEKLEKKNKKLTNALILRNDELLKARDALRWRKYPEEKPKSGDWCLVMAGSRKDAGLRRYYGGDESWYNDKHLSKVTHWLPIPPLEEK